MRIFHSQLYICSLTTNYQPMRWNNSIHEKMLSYNKDMEQFF